MSEYTDRYVREPHSREAYVFEATYLATHHPETEIKTRFIATYADEVADYIKERLLGEVLSIRYVTAANLIL